jgi:hypothetical protein
MEGYRIGEFGEKQMKGINLAVKALAKKFPFVTGWELSDNWDRHFNLININLIVDLEKVGEYYNVEINDYWIGRWNSDEVEDTSYILSTAYKTDLDNLVETNKIRKKMDDIYSSLPDDFCMFYRFDDAELNKFENKCFINIRYYVNKPSQNIYYSI